MAELFEAINTRAMVREFKDTPLGDEEKQRILQAGIRAPTAGGNEQWLFLCVESAEKREKLLRLLVEAQKAYYTEMLKTPLSKEQMDNWMKSVEKGRYRAPFYVAVFVDLRQRFYTKSDVEELWGQQSAAAAIENMLLAAWGLGISGCWFGVPLLIEKEFYEFFDAKKDEMRLAAVLAFGYPKQMPTPRRRKKGLETVVKSI
ncbi:MAG: nitroreductase family protein [Candidatus Verstraetearchaeota archaeon]|nr:nitroreductase family protein [Candidatus Verstraetearchaeota archaeon]